MTAYAYMTIDGIDGFSTDATYTNWIEITSLANTVTHDVSNSNNTTGAALSGSGRPTFSNVVINKNVDPSSPQLMLKCCQGSVIAAITIDLLDSSAVPVLRYEFTNAIITSVQTSASVTTTIKLSEIVSFVFSTIKATYSPAVATRANAASTSNTSGGWDRSNNKVFPLV